MKCYVTNKLNDLFSYLFVMFFLFLKYVADALKLVLKEQIIPSQAQKSLFFLAPMISLIFSLLGWGVIPFGEGLTLTDFSLGILYSLCLSSIGVYGILFAGWSANSKYAFLGSLVRDICKEYDQIVDATRSTLTDCNDS